MQYSIEQLSPIDFKFQESFEDEFPRENIPIETAMPGRLRIMVSRDWINQLVEPMREGNVVVSSINNEGLLIQNSTESSGLRVSLCGLHITSQNGTYDIDNLPNNVLDLYLKGFDIIENWRARVVCLSLETDNGEIECSLMDDLFPPKSILAEYKTNSVLRSIKLQKGMVTITTVERTVGVPLAMIESEKSLKSILMHATPELKVVEMDAIWAEFVQLRILCLKEHKRLHDGTVYMHGG